MGRGRGKHTETWQDPDRDDPQGKWKVWPGAYSPSRAPWWPKAKAKPTFPTYSGVSNKATPTQQPPTPPGQGPEPGGLVPDMQAALNIARRAEIKVSKLHKAYDQAQEQWAEYDRLAKANYQRELRRFQKDLARIEKEAVEAEDQQQQSRDMVIKVAQEQLLGKRLEKPAPSTDNSVHALFDSWAAEEGRDLDGVYKRALNSQAAPPCTPTRPQHYSAASPVSTGRAPALTDPYLHGAAGASPTLASGPASAPHGGPPGLSPGTRQIPKHPGQRDMSLSRSPAGEAPPRAGIKEATKGKAQPATGHVTLEMKLQERRERENAKLALRPFGVGAIPGARAAGSAETVPVGWGGLAAMTLDDDDPDLEEPPGAPRLSELESLPGNMVYSFVLCTASVCPPEPCAILSAVACTAELYSLASGTVLVDRFPGAPSLPSYVAFVILGHLNSSFGFGRVLGEPPPGFCLLRHPCFLSSALLAVRSFRASFPIVGHAVVPRISRAPKTHIGGAGVSACHAWTLRIPLHGLPFPISPVRFSPDPLGLLPNFVSAASDEGCELLPRHTGVGFQLGSAPKTHIGGSGVSAYHLVTPCFGSSFSVIRTTAAFMPHGASPAVRACGYVIPVSEVGFFTFLAPGVPSQPNCPQEDTLACTLMIFLQVALQPTTCSATVGLLQVTFIAMLTTVSLLTLSPNLSIMLLLRQFTDSQTLPVLGVLALHDALDAVERQVQHLRLEGCDRAIAVRPQPFPTCAAFVLAPDWATYSSLSIVCLDLRDLGDSTEGPVLVSYVTRPTCLAELCREASVHSPQHCKVYIGTEAEPLQEDEEVNLASGCLVTFMRTDRLPCHANDLQYRLQFPGIWQTPPRFPTGPAVRSSLLLLHSSGRYLYRPQAAHDPGDVAAARFVGVDRVSVDFHAPQDGCLERVMYRGIRVRGTLAIAEHHYDPQFVVFLDLRQVAEGVQFVVLDVPYILLVHLPRLVRFQPPPGWALKVRGGRRRRDRIEIDNSATLVFSFQYVCTSDSSETPFDPTSDGDDGDSDGAPDDSDSEDTDRRSSATTRSRSRRRGSPGTDPGHSSDHSYQGGVMGFRELEPLVSPVHLPGLLVDAACLPGADPHVDWQQDARLHFLASAIGSGTRRLLADEGAAFYRRAPCRYAGAPELILEPHTLLAAFQAALHAKLLSEPVPHGSADAARLRALRHATEHLGGDWRYFAPTTRLHASLAEVPDSSSDEDQEVRLRRAAFIICTPGYAPEFVVVEVQFPTTLPELIPRLRAARRPEQDFRFPHLTPATPQPIEGTGLFLAAPHWCANARVVCIDATRLNGRLFAAYAPAYADNDTLADLSGAHGLDATFYAGLSQEPIPEGVLTHLVAGSTVSIFAPHIEPPPLQDLGQLLLDAGQWSSRPLYVYPEPADAYCLVRATHHQLFRADPGKPTQYRRRLAAAVGAPEAHITVTPSAPRVVGIDIAGVPCRTAVAVSIHTPDRALRRQQDIILDCRPIQEGLSLWPAHSGLLFLPDLLAHFQSRVPVGYSVQVTPDTRHGVHLSVHAGAVVVVDFVAQHPHAPQASRGLSAAAPGPPDQRRVHFAADPPSHAQEGNDLQRPIGSGPGEFPVPVSTVPSAASTESFQAVFLVFAPCYLPEFIEVQLNAPVPSSEAIAAVQAARLPSHRERFPRLLAVTPQPDMEYGTLLAAPEWPMSEVLVFFDLRGFDDRYFALNVPSTMTLGSLVTVADVPATAELLVYIRDMPWPLGGDVPVDLLPGDLVVFLRPDHSIAVHASLGDMLQQSVGWASEPDIPGEYGDRIWLVTDHEPLLFEVNRRRAHAFRQDVAAALDISSHSIRLQPVWPNILTFAAQGLLVRSVLIAVESPPLPADGTSGWVVCLLDLRPILLGLVAAHAPDGRYDAPGLRQRLQGFCPPGYCVAITGGHTRDDSSTGYLTVFAGEVLSVNFVALASTSLSSTPEVSRNEPGDGGDPGATPGPSSENGLGAPPSSSTSRPNARRDLPPSTPAARDTQGDARRSIRQTPIAAIPDASDKASDIAPCGKVISPLCSSPFRPIAGRLVYPDKIAVALPFAARRGDILQFCFLLSAYPPSQGKLSRFIAVHLKAQPVTALLTSLVCPVDSLLGCPSTPVLPFASPSILIQLKGASPQQAIEDFDDQSASSSSSCAAVSGAVPPWALQDERPSAYIAECYALLVAAWLSITKFAQIPVTLRSDCQSAIGVFQGCFVGAPCGVAAVLRSLGLFALEFSPHPPQAAYVAGHSGCLGNELADCLARSAAQASPCGCLRWSPDGAKPWWFQDGHSLGWAAIAVANLSANAMYPGPHVDEVPPCADSIGLAPLQLDGFNLLFVSAHVHAHSALVLVGGDMNASVGSVTSAAIGGQDPDQQDDAGPSGTYVQKRNGAFSRIDFIACPAEWRAGHINTWTDESIPAPHRRFDGRAMLTPSGQAKVEGILKAAPRIPWAASPHAHASTLVHYLQDSLAAAFPPQKGRCYRAYLSDSTWQLHGEVMRLRKQCVSVKRALSFHLVAAVFQVWKQADSGPLLHMLNSQWTKEAQYAGAVQSHFLCLTSQRLKAACKHDRAVHFSELADDVQNSRPNADKAVQRLMGLRRKKPFRPEVLPELHKADGSRCVTPAEATERWREHFREQEDGYDIAPEMLPGLASGPGFVLSPDMLTELPSPDILLQVIASSHKGKAAGPDGLPAEVGHASPQCLAQLLMPLMLKMGLTCVEPIGFKGGTLTKLYKGRGDTAQCASYRAIMLLPTLAKLLHKAFRPGLYEVFHSNASPAQLGGLKNTSVVLGSHITRAFGRYCAANSITSVVLFADVASAYYTAVRALTARKHVADGEDDNAYMPTREHLAEELSKPSAMRQAHASPWIESLTAELNSNTWMCLAGDSQPVVTRQGSRPGSSFADLFYGVTVPRWRDEARNGAASPASSLSDVEHAPVIWWDGRFDFSEPCTDPTACTTSTTLCDVIWADDLAKCIAVHNAGCAAAATATECGLLADAFYAHGYELSFGPAKTAAIVVPRGAGSRQARKTLFSGKSVLPIFREEVGCASLPLVTTYRHLGVKISSSISIMTELRHRASHAWSAFQQGRTKVFRTRRISVKKRGLLLSTHVMTKLLFAAGAWPPLSKGEHSFFFRTVVSLYRQTLSIPHGDDQHLTHATICALVGQPPPEVLLLTERARYLLQLLNAAPEQLWALVRRDAAYVAHLRSALFWVYRWVCDTSNLGSPDDQWPEWEQVMRHRPHIFKALIKRAQGLELMRTACYAALQAVRRALEQLVKGSPPPEPKGIRYQEACLQCKIAFPSRTAWACHASRLHAYRASSTLLAAGCDRPVCKACGRLYASIGRLKRHLNTSESCRRGWGAFHPLPGGTSTLHPEAPPVALPGVHDGFSAALDPAKVHPGLLRELQELSTPLTEDVWDVVQGYIEPLPLLKDTLEEWAQHPGPEQDTDIAAAIAGDVCLLLDPELWCEDFRAPKSPPMPAVACPPFADFDFGRLSFVLTGAEHIVDIEEPPLRAFVYPFGASVPLAAARRHTAWMEATCDAIGLTLQQSLASPVRIRLSPLAAECLKPIPTWLESCGFRVEPGCIRSPRG
ncbi:unnamed protein product [Symbiodinium sp. CCMP2592]|nr:unnamed protein product [Symbiodinium sp. CCMP2592]